MAIFYRGDKGQALTAAEYDATIKDLHERPDGITLPETINTGIKVDHATPDFPWHDLIGDMQDHMAGAAGVSAGSAVFIGNIGQPRFDVGDSQQFGYHIPHDWVQGHDAYIHIHWSHNTAGVTTGDVTFQLEFTAAKGHNVAAFPLPKVIQLTEAASTTRYQHMIGETPFCETGGGVGGTLLNSEDMEVDTMILCHVTVVGNTMDASALPFIHSVDLHYQSTNVGTKNRNPTPTFWG